MMWDVENQLSAAQAFTGAATVTTNSYKKQSASQDIFIGRRMALLLIPTVAQGAGSTMVFEAIDAADAALTTTVAALSSVSVLAASAPKGAYIECPIPQGLSAQQYIGGRVTLTGGATTITCDIYLVPQEEIAKYKSFTKVVDALV